MHLIIQIVMRTYTYDEAFKASLEYFKGDELAARVWVNKYAMKDSFGNIYEQSPSQQKISSIFSIISDISYQQEAR